MKKHYYALFAALCFLTLSSRLHAQQDAATTGGDASGTGGSVSFTIGQPNYINTGNANGGITEGLQQPYEILIVTGIAHTDVVLSCKAYPNPAIQTLYLELKDISGRSYSYSVSNLSGQQILQQTIHAKLSEIDLGTLPTGNYLVTVYNDNTEVKTFKIIKSK